MKTTVRSPTNGTLFFFFLYRQGRELFELSGNRQRGDVVLT